VEKKPKGGERAQPWKPCFDKQYYQSVEPRFCKPYENCADDTNNQYVKVHCRAHRKSKVLKARKGKIGMVLGLDVGMDLVAQLSSYGLVGKSMFHNRFSKEAMLWLERSLSSFLGYSPTINFIMKGWLSITCWSESDALAVLKKSWLWGSYNLVLKRWHPVFNPKMELFKTLHVWALLLGLPL
jgi:hypothetical protein